MTAGDFRTVIVFNNSDSAMMSHSGIPAVDSEAPVIPYAEDNVVIDERKSGESVHVALLVQQQQTQPSQGLAGVRAQGHQERAAATALVTQSEAGGGAVPRAGPSRRRRQRRTKPFLYDHEPFDDLEKEKRRMKARKAKNNREKQKRETEGKRAQLKQTEEEVTALRQERSDRRSLIEKYEKELARQQALHHNVPSAGTTCYVQSFPQQDNNVTANQLSTSTVAPASILYQPQLAPPQVFAIPTGARFIKSQQSPDGTLYLTFLQ